jgi:hypothetical protein
MRVGVHIEIEIRILREAGSTAANERGHEGNQEETETVSHSRTYAKTV